MCPRVPVIQRILVVVGIDAEDPGVEHRVAHEEKHAQGGSDRRTGTSSRNVPLPENINHWHDVDHS